MSVFLHEGDLPAGLAFPDGAAIDSETLGLSLVRDALCLVQISAGDGTAHIVRLDRSGYDCPNLKRLLTDPGTEKILHYARFDVAMFKRDLGVVTAPLFCTKIASKLARTYTDRHGLKDVVKEILGLDLQKQQQSSDWGAAELTPSQLQYAAADVLHLHALRRTLKGMLEREGRTALAAACFAFVAHRAELDLAGWSDVDIFAHT